MTGQFFKKSSYFILVLHICMQNVFCAENKLCFVTATDTEHFTWTLNLIASIQRFHPDDHIHIAVYNLGLTPEEQTNLQSLASVAIYDVETVNPHMLEKFQVNKKGKIARGWYSWKPVVLKQAAELFPEFFYLDSGITLQGPMYLLFEHLHQNGYFLIDCGHSIRRMTITKLIEKFQLLNPENQWILDQPGISSGVQGISQRVYENYLLPIYKLSYHIENFADDGSCPKGFGWARHDQTLFSIQARLLQLKIYPVIRGGALYLTLQDRTVKMHLDDFIRVTRQNFDLHQSKQFLRYRDPSPWTKD